MVCEYKCTLSCFTAVSLMHSVLCCTPVKFGRLACFWDVSVSNLLWLVVSSVHAVRYLQGYVAVLVPTIVIYLLPRYKLRMWAVCLPVVPLLAL